MIIILPGGFNDPDYLLFQDAGGKFAQTEQQVRLQFSVYAMLAAPLIISQDLSRSRESQFVMQTLLNKEVIAVDQDVLGIQGIRIIGSNFTSCSTQPVCVCVWLRRLDAGRFALLFANAGVGQAPSVVVPATLLATHTGLDLKQQMRVRDLWAGASRPVMTIGEGFASSPLAAFAVELFVLAPAFDAATHDE
jgi:alpha-galactosidase